MSTPESLKLNDELHLALEEIIVVSVVGSACVCSLTIEASSTFILSPIVSHDLLVVHVKLGMFTILSHAIRAICRTVSHFYFPTFLFSKLLKFK